MQLTALVLAAVIQPLWPEAKVPDAQPQQIAAPSQEVSRPGFNAESTGCRTSSGPSSLPRTGEPARA